MGRPPGIDARPARLLAIALTAVSAALVACALHARLAAGPAHLDGRPSIGDACIAADEDLRHPGWARPEQARAGQPLLDDPRAARWFVAPAAVRVVK